MRRILVSLAVLVIVGCSAAAGIMKGNPTDIVHGVAESTQNVVGLSQDLAKCDSLGTADVTFDEERTIGGTVALNWVQQGGGLLVDSPAGTDFVAANLKSLVVADTPYNRMTRYLNVVGRNLAARSTRPTLQWTFGVLDSPAVNAVSAPGGYVFVTRGLLQRVDNEAALAGILSHEIAHVTRKDAFLIYQKTKVDQCKTLAYAKAGQKEGMGALRNYGPNFIKGAIYALDSFSGGPLDLNAAANNALLTLFSDEFVHRYLESGYARDQELGADAIGLELTVATGYNPRGFIDFIGALPPGPAFFAHHPPGSDRAAAMKALLAKRGGAPFSPFAQDTSQLPRVPLRDELAAAR
jgi:beta-barrel assembly-enhancing protease